MSLCLTIVGRVPNEQTATAAHQPKLLEVIQQSMVLVQLPRTAHNAALALTLALTLALAL